MPLPDIIYHFGYKWCYPWDGGLHDGSLCHVVEEDTGLKCSITHWVVQSCITYLGAFRHEVQAM